VREASPSAGNKAKIVVEFKADSPSIRKKMTSLPGSIEKTVLDRDKDHVLKNSVIL
jgi:hypothetical protein